MALLENKTVEAELLPAEQDRVEAIDTSIGFDEHVARFKSKVGRNRKNTIKTIWEMGQFVSLLKKNKAYGDKTVDSFVEAMNDSAVSASEVYKWAQFAERYSEEDVNRLLGYSNIGWGVVSNLIRIKDVEARRAVEEGVHTGTILPAKVQKAVSDINQTMRELEKKNAGKEDKPSDKKTGSGSDLPPGTNKCVANFRKANNLLDKLLTLKEKCAKDIVDLSALLGNTSRYNVAVQSMNEFRANVPKMREMLNELDEQLGKTIE